MRSSTAEKAPTESLVERVQIETLVRRTMVRKVGKWESWTLKKKILVGKVRKEESGKILVGKVESGKILVGKGKSGILESGQQQWLVKEQKICEINAFSGLPPLSSNII